MRNRVVKRRMHRVLWKKLSRIYVLLSMAFRLSKTTQQSRKEVILLSPIHGLNGICPV